MALQINPEAPVIRQPHSMRDLLLSALRMDNVPAPEMDSTGAVALRPRYPMRGVQAEPAPVAEIRYPQAEAGHAIAKAAALTQGMDLSTTMAAAKGTPLTTPVVVAEKPKRPVPSIQPGFITQSMDRSRARSWGR
jgi:hypothetical protein